jgi:hypothetical protein
MAARGQELNTRITATNEASAVFSQAGQDAERLEGRLDRLTSEERKIVLEAEASKLEREVERAYKSLATLRDQDQIDIVIDAKDQAKAKLERVRDEIEQLDRQSADVEVTADVSQAESQLDSLMGKLREMDGPIGDLAGKFDAIGGSKAGAAGGVGAIVTGLVLATDQVANLAIEVDNTARLTGGTVEETSKLLGVWKQAGFDVTDFQDVLLQMNGVLADSPELAEQLGLNMRDGKDLGERFLEVVDRLGTQFEDTAERSQMASKLFGEEGVRQVNAVEGAYGDLNSAVDDYNGKVFTAEEVQKAREYKRALGEVTTEFKTMGNEVGSDLLPVLADTLSTLNEIGSWTPPIPGGQSGWEMLGNGIKVALGGNASAAKVAMEDALDDVDARAQRSAAVVSDSVGAAWRDVLDAARSALDVDTEPVVNASSIIQGEIDAAADRFARFGSDGVENMNDVGDAASDTADAVGDVEDAFADLRREIDQRQEYRSLQDQFDRVEQAAIDAWNAAADGAEDAEARARDYQAELDSLREKVIDYGESIVGLPDQFTTNIIALLDAGKVAEAEAWMARVATGVTLPIKPQVINTGGNTAVRVDENGNVRTVPPRASHTGSVVTAGERLRVLSGQEIEFTAPAAGRVFSREDVARQGASSTAGGVVVYETHHHYHTTNQVGVDVVAYGADDMFVDDLTNRIAFRLGGAG